MIKIDNSQAVATFGTGDIGIYVATRIEDGLNILGFCSQMPREIGRVGDFIAGEPIQNDEFQIIFEFPKVESIDVLIESLEQVRDNLITSE